MSSSRETRYVYVEGEVVDGPPGGREFTRRGVKVGQLVQDILALEPGQWLLVSKGDASDVKSRRSRADSARRNAIKFGAKHALRVRRTTDHEIWIECVEVDQ